ncbi:MAG: NAD(P)-binding protein [Myxococcales bacterium]|nr:NAD(P)-binding protein [Myxococcales bacterium]
MSASPQSPRKIAILGGGLGGLATALHLTNNNKGADLDITIYQMGWRLGGKCASSRGEHGRIEEHGLHVLLGSYENAFASIRRCYADLARPPSCPIRTFDDAFQPQDTVVFQELIAGQLRPWSITFPRNQSTPGDGGIWPSPRDYGQMVRYWLRLGSRILLAEVQRRTQPTALLSALRAAAMEVLAAVGDDAKYRDGDGGLNIVTSVRRILVRLRKNLAELLTEDDELRRLWILLDLAAACLTGMATDRVYSTGFDALDDEDFRLWLTRHGASDTAVNSALVRSVYDLCFHAPDDDRPETGFGAGTALRMTLRFVGAYKGAVGWWMKAGTGEILVAPLYEVLRRRGVKFAFFHRVRNLELSADGQRLTKVVVGVQATVRSGPLTYEPLQDIGGLPTWPGAPDAAQLVEGDQLSAQAIDLEASWSGWADVETVELQDGRDYDEVVLAISQPALPAICGQLAAHHPHWRQLLATVQSTPTIALQIWSKAKRKSGKPMMNTGLSPLTGYGDMSHLLRHEAWPTQPGHVLHVCNRLESVAPPDASETGFHQRENERAKAIARQWLDDGGGAFIPGATRTGQLEPLDWQVLVDPSEREGAERLDGQFWCANVEPTDRYVLSAPRTVGARLRAGDSGITNLTLAGAWVRTGLNIGAVESAFMSGMQASRALIGTPRRVFGEHDFM